MARPKTQVVPVRHRWVDHDLDVMRSRVVGYHYLCQGCDPGRLRETWRAARADLATHIREQHTTEGEGDAT